MHHSTWDKVEELHQYTKRSQNLYCQNAIQDETTNKLKTEKHSHCLQLKLSALDIAAQWPFAGLTGNTNINLTTIAGTSVLQYTHFAIKVWLKV